MIFIQNNIGYPQYLNHQSIQLQLNEDKLSLLKPRNHSFFYSMCRYAAEVIANYLRAMLTILHTTLRTIAGSVTQVLTITLLLE